MSDDKRLQQLRDALIDLAIASTCYARLRRHPHQPSPAEARLRTALARAHAALDRRDPHVPPDSPLQVVGAAIDYARELGAPWTDIVALVSRETVVSDDIRTRRDIDS